MQLLSYRGAALNDTGHNKIILLYIKKATYLQYCNAVLFENTAVAREHVKMIGVDTI